MAVNPFFPMWANGVDASGGVNPGYDANGNPLPNKQSVGLINSKTPAQTTGQFGKVSNTGKGFVGPGQVAPTGENLYAGVPSNTDKGFVGPGQVPSGGGVSSDVKQGQYQQLPGKQPPQEAPVIGPVSNTDKGFVGAANQPSRVPGKPGNASSGTIFNGTYGNTGIVDPKTDPSKVPSKSGDASSDAMFGGQYGNTGIVDPIKEQSSAATVSSPSASSSTQGSTSPPTNNPFGYIPPAPINVPPPPANTPNLSPNLAGMYPGYPAGGGPINNPPAGTNNTAGSPPTQPNHPSVNTVVDYYPGLSTETGSITNPDQPTPTPTPGGVTPNPAGAPPSVATLAEYYPGINTQTGTITNPAIQNTAQVGSAPSTAQAGVNPTVAPNLATGIINSGNLGNPNANNPVNPYDVAQAQASLATGQGYEATATTVNQDQTVAGQIKRIIDEGGPLQEQAQARARQDAASRGLVNSSMGVQAGQAALYQAALPIAQQDANTYAAANTATSAARNAAAQFGAAAGNTASSLNAQLQTGAGQNNAGATNAARSMAQQIGSQQTLAGMQQAAQVYTSQLQSVTQQQLQNVQSNTQLSLADKSTAVQSYLQQLQSNTQQQIAGVQANTSLTLADKNNVMQEIMAAQNISSQQYLAQLQSTTQQQLASIQADTTLTVTDKNNASSNIINTVNQANQVYLGQLNNFTNQKIASIQSDTTLTVTDKNNMTSNLHQSQAIQQQQWAAQYQLYNDLSKIQASGLVSANLADIDGKYKAMLQNNASATSMYQAYMGQLSSILSNPNISDKKTAMNNVVDVLNKSLTVMGYVSDVAGVPNYANWLQFTSNVGTAGNYTTPVDTTVINEEGQGTVTQPNPGNTDTGAGGD